MKQMTLEYRVKRLESILLKNENISVSTFDCEQLALMIQDKLNKFDSETFVDVVDDNADYGFINIGIDCSGNEDSYDVEVKEYNQYEVTYKDKSIGVFKSLADAAKAISDKFIKTYNLK